MTTTARTGELGRIAERSEFPRLRDLPRIAIDLETHDPDLREKGPGCRRDGYIVGVAVAVDGHDSAYWPVAHDMGRNRPEVIDWLREELGAFRGDVIGANVLYDLDFLACAGVRLHPEARIRDVQVAAAVHDELRDRYNLESLSQDYLGEGKRSDAMEAAWGKGWVSRVREIWPDSLAPYARGDVELSIRLHDRLERLLREDEWLRGRTLWDVYQLETALLPMLLWMRQVGVRVDVERTESLVDVVEGRIKLLQGEVNGLAGREVNVWANASLAAAFDRAGIDYRRTAKGSPSFRASWLEANPSPLARKVLELRNLDKFHNTFLRGHILGNVVGDRIHCQFHPLRDGDYGSKSGRFSSSNPNLQQIPSRDPKLARSIRSLFLPEEGKLWGTFDLSQIEFRFFAHFAQDPTLVDAYRRGVDYHAAVGDALGFGAEDRKAVKGFNFGLLYGAGPRKVAEMLVSKMDKEKAAANYTRICRELGEGTSFRGYTPHERMAHAVLALYAERFPAARRLMDSCARKVERRGWIRTILGRRRRFDLWEPATAGGEIEDTVPARLEEAKEKWPDTPLRRAYAFRGLNALLQGSAADYMKAAMLGVWESGVLSAHGGPVDLHLTIHDELDFSFPETEEGDTACREIHRCMTEALPLTVPVEADGAVGRTWADAKG